VAGTRPIKPGEPLRNAGPAALAGGFDVRDLNLPRWWNCGFRSAAVPFDPRAWRWFWGLSALAQGTRHEAALCSRSVRARLCPLGPLRPQQPRAPRFQREQRQALALQARCKLPLTLTRQDKKAGIC